MLTKGSHSLIDRTMRLNHMVSQREYYTQSEVLFNISVDNFTMQAGSRTLAGSTDTNFLLFTIYLVLLFLPSTHMMASAKSSGICDYNSYYYFRHQTESLKYLHLSDLFMLLSTIGMYILVHYFTKIMHHLKILSGVFVSTNK